MRLCVFGVLYINDFIRVVQRVDDLVRQEWLECPLPGFDFALLTYLDGFNASTDTACQLLDILHIWPLATFKQRKPRAQYLGCTACVREKLLLRRIVVDPSVPPNFRVKR